MEKKDYKLRQKKCNLLQTIIVTPTMQEKLNTLSFTDGTPDFVPSVRGRKGSKISPDSQCLYHLLQSCTHLHTHLLVHRLTYTIPHTRVWLSSKLDVTPIHDFTPMSPSLAGGNTRLVDGVLTESTREIY